MIELSGKYNSAKIFTDELDQESISQIINICNQEHASGSKIRIMPDVHAGKGCVIGYTATYEDKVCPNLVGVDIACGMLVTEFSPRKTKKPDFQVLDNTIRKYIPHGQNVRSDVYTKAEYFEEMLKELKCYDKIDTRRAMQSIGSLGGGNHFIEVNESDGKYYLVIHSGSRNLGLQVATYYQKLAKETHPELPFETAYVSDAVLNDYIHDVAIITEYAKLNRKTMCDIICSEMKFEIHDQFETLHNYIDIENKIIRKGSVSAQEGERFIVPINMKDGSLICVGKGNPDWNFSAPHGAGRKYSRSEAKEMISVNQFMKDMEGIWTSCVSKNTLDEAPGAYKSIDAILDNINDTADVIDIIKPVYNFKG